MYNNYLLKLLKEDFFLFQKNRTKYKSKLRDISNILNLKGCFNDSVLPQYFSGNIDAIQKKIIIIGINPGNSMQNLIAENKFIGVSFSNYRNFHTNFFSIYKNSIRLPINYYSYLSTCFNPIITKYRNLEYFNFCQDNIINIDLIPYHSTNFRLKLNQQNLAYLKNQFLNLTEFLFSMRKKINFVVTHKKLLNDMLQQIGFLKDSVIIKSFNSNKSVLFKNHQGIKYLIFSRFVPYGGFSRDEIQNILKLKKIRG